MKVFAGPRGSGRTAALIRWCQEDAARVLVIQNEANRLQVAMRAVRSGQRVAIATVTSLNTAIWPLQKVEFAVDDYSEMMWSGICIGNSYGHLIGAIALTSDDYINLAPPPALLSEFQIVDNLRTMVAELRG